MRIRRVDSYRSHSTLRKRLRAITRYRHHRRYPCGHPAKLLELAEAAFDEVALCVKMFVERIFEQSRGIVGDDGLCAFFGCSFSDVVGIVSGVGDDKFSRGCEKSAGFAGRRLSGPR